MSMENLNKRISELEQLIEIQSKGAENLEDCRYLINQYIKLVEVLKLKILLNEKN